MEKKPIILKGSLSQGGETPTIKQNLIKDAPLINNIEEQIKPTEIDPFYELDDLTQALFDGMCFG